MRAAACCLLIFCLCAAAGAQTAALFPRIRALGLEPSRALALRRSGSLALADVQLAAARADLAEQQKRIRPATGGGLDPFTGQVRYYLSLDLERLFALNGEARTKARRQVEAEQIGRGEAEATAIRRVTAAWYALRTAEAGVTSAAEARETTQALYVATDARFKAGEGTLQAVLSSLRATREADDALTAARNALALACLDLAQACGYRTAEEMEADLK